MSNSDFYDIVNVGSHRLADDGECIRDAFIKINNNNSLVFNTMFGYDIDILFGGWKLIVGVDNKIVVSNSINVSNSVGVNIATMVANTNNIDLDFNIENSLNLNVENNLNLSINNSGITLISDVSNNVVLTANSFTSTNVIYAPSLTNTTNTNNITFNANDIDITNTFGDININAVTNDINFTGDIVMNTNMFDINVTTGDINIQNGAITIDNALFVDINNAITVDASQEVNINNALFVDASNNINIGINNAFSIDASQNITFAPNTTFDFSNLTLNNLDVSLTEINQITFNELTVTSNDILIYNSNSGKFETSKNIVADKLTINHGVIESTTSLEGQGGGVVVHDTNVSHIFTHTQLTGNFTANFTNVEMAANQATAITLILTQGGTAYIPNAVQINGSPKTILWQSGGAPAGTINGTDAVTFSVLYDGTNYTILGNLISHS